MRDSASAAGLDAPWARALRHKRGMEKRKASRPLTMPANTNAPSKPPYPLASLHDNSHVGRAPATLFILAHRFLIQPGVGLGWVGLGWVGLGVCVWEGGREGGGEREGGGWSFFLFLFLGQGR
jgi:hypothetical protein